MGNAYFESNSEIEQKYYTGLTTNVAGYLDTSLEMFAPKEGDNINSHSSPLG